MASPESLWNEFVRAVDEIAKLNKKFAEAYDEGRDECTRVGMVFKWQAELSEIACKYPRVFKEDSKE